MNLSTVHMCGHKFTPINILKVPPLFPECLEYLGIDLDPVKSYCDNPKVKDGVSHLLFKSLICWGSVSAPMSLSRRESDGVLLGGRWASRNLTEGYLVRNAAGCVLCCLLLLQFVHIDQLQPSWQQLHYHFAKHDNYNSCLIFHYKWTVKALEVSRSLVFLCLPS